MMKSQTFAGWLLFCMSAVLHGQATQPTTAPEATRTDLARAYLAFEHAYRDHPPAKDRIAGVNRAFDRATMLFFAGSAAKAIEELNTLRKSISPVDPAVPQDPFSPAEDERPLAIGKGAIPALLFIPRQDEPHALPLVIALHGAGGTENMFMRAYGAGRLKSLAGKRGFILLCPATLGVIPARDFIPDAVAAVNQSSGHNIVDRSRVYLIGHSLGAFAAVTLAVREGDRLAAMCLIAGAGRLDLVPSLPPTLLIAGALDPIVRPARMQDAFDRAKAAGKDVDLRTFPDYGHTLIVGDSTTEAIDWLLRHRKQ